MLCRRARRLRSHSQTAEWEASVDAPSALRRFMSNRPRAPATARHVSRILHAWQIIIAQQKAASPLEFLRHTKEVQSDAETNGKLGAVPLLGQGRIVQESTSLSARDLAEASVDVWQHKRRDGHRHVSHRAAAQVSLSTRLFSPLRRAAPRTPAGPHTARG